MSFARWGETIGRLKSLFFDFDFQIFRPSLIITPDTMDIQLTIRPFEIVQ